VSNCAGMKSIVNSSIGVVSKVKVCDSSIEGSPKSVDDGDQVGSSCW